MRLAKKTPRRGMCPSPSFFSSCCPLALGASHAIPLAVRSESAKPWPMLGYPQRTPPPLACREHLPRKNRGGNRPRGPESCYDGLTRITLGSER